jgi:hypothetical protein
MMLCFQNLRLLTLGVAGFFFSVSASNAQDFSTFKVQNAKGDTCQVQPNGKEWMKAENGSSHGKGTKGKTGSGSSFVAAFNEQTLFRILPETEVVIGTESKTGYRKVINLSLRQGNVDVELEKLPKGYKMEVQTPTAVCGAVGTKFTVQRAKDGKETFTCTESEIEVASHQDKSFRANILEKQRLSAKASPGKDNSHTELSTNDDIEIDIGTHGNTIKAQKGTEFRFAQKKNSKDVALRITKGAVNGESNGRYLMEGDKLLKFDGKTEKSQPALVDNYIDASEKEGAAKRSLDAAAERGSSPETIQNLEAQLDQAAEEANKHRTALFEARKAMRDAFRDAARPRGPF